MTYTQETIDALVNADARRGSNNECIDYIRTRTNFRNAKGSLYGVWTKDDSGFALFVVYSYGPHFPMALWSPQAEEWFVTTSRYSASTDRHLSLLRRAIAAYAHSRLAHTHLQDATAHGLAALVTAKMSLAHQGAVL